MVLTGDARPIVVTPSRRGFGWWAKSDQAPESLEIDPAASSRLSPSSAATPQPSPVSPISTTMEALNMPPKRPRIHAPIKLTGDTDEELFHMSIADRLGPEPSTLASTKQLRRNAWALLQRFQKAYREQSVAVAQMKAEVDKTAADAAQHAKRSSDLKRKLDAMSKKALEQEDAMQEMLLALSAEKKARIEEHEHVLVHSPAESPRSSVAAEPQKALRRSVPSSVASEDLGVDVDQTDDESTAEDASIFSRPRSPTATATVRSSVATTNISVGVGAGAGEDAMGPPPPHPGISRMSSFNSTYTVPNRRVSQLQQATGFQKLWKGFGGESVAEMAASCANCQGQSASMAWDTVTLLRDENKELKSRVTVLETAVDSAIDAANGVATLVVSMNPSPKEAA